MIVWEHHVIRGRARGENDANRVRGEFYHFLREEYEGPLPLGGHTQWEAGDILWGLAANAAEWSREPSADVALEASEDYAAIHVSDRGVGVERALGRPVVEAFQHGTTSSRRSGRGRGLNCVTQMTIKGGRFVLESIDIAVTCINGKVASSAKSASPITGTHTTFIFCSPT